MRNAQHGRYYIPIFVAALVLMVSIAGCSKGSGESKIFELAEPFAVSVQVDVPRGWSEKASESMVRLLPSDAGEHDMENLSIFASRCPGSDADDAAWDDCVKRVFERRHGDSIDGAERESLSGDRLWVEKRITDGPTGENLAGDLYIPTEDGLVMCGAALYEHQDRLAAYRGVCESLALP